MMGFLPVTHTRWKACTQPHTSGWCLFKWLAQKDQIIYTMLHVGVRTALHHADKSFSYIDYQLRNGIKTGILGRY